MTQRECNSNAITEDTHYRCFEILNDTLTYVPIRPLKPLLRVNPMTVELYHRIYEQLELTVGPGFENFPKVIQVHNNLHCVLIRDFTQRL